MVLYALLPFRWICFSSEFLIEAMDRVTVGAQGLRHFVIAESVVEEQFQRFTIFLVALVAQCAEELCSRSQDRDGRGQQSPLCVSLISDIPGELRLEFAFQLR